MIELKGRITAIVLTFNEEQHIARCIKSLKGLGARVCVIDSNSTDRTVQIASELGADIYVNPWKNYATQFEWGMREASIQSDWTLRIDADEYLTAELQRSLQDFVDSPGEANAVYMRRKIVFLDRAITHGFFYPAMMLRLWRSGEGRIEQRWMDEHIVVENARVVHLRGDLIDENLNDLSWWTEKHLRYATREVYDLVSLRAGMRSEGHAALSGQARTKRLLKEKLYARLPSALRSSLYFFYRYFVGAGFLDGKAGFFFHFMQAYWYRTLVDAKLWELEQQASRQNISAYELLRRKGVWDTE